MGPGRNPDPIALGGDSGLRRRRYLCQAKDALVTLKRSDLFATMFPMAKSEGGGGKRQVSITVKMSSADLELLEKAIKVLWADAPVTKSSAVLALMRRAAKAALGQKAS